MAKRWFVLLFAFLCLLQSSNCAFSKNSDQKGALRPDDLALEIIEHEASKPQPAGIAAASAGIAQQIAWPNGLKPKPETISPKPSDSDKLPKADYLIVTWTSDEADTLAKVLTPGVSSGEWYLYSHKWDVFEPMFWSKSGPATSPTNRNGGPNRYYKKLGSYYMTKVGTQKILCFKSNLHIHTDGPKIPLVPLWKQLISEVSPKAVITTGTGGAVGSQVKLGDVIVAEKTTFKLVGKGYKDLPYAHSTYNCTKYGAEVFQAVKSEMLKLTQDKLKPLRDELPIIYYPGSAIKHPAIVTTDDFLFDDTENTDGLQGLGEMVEMDDATLGVAINEMHSSVKWVAIRNASDPQMDCKHLANYHITCAKPGCREMAGCIYKKYGSWTCIPSILACWAIVANDQ